MKKRHPFTTCSLLALTLMGSISGLEAARLQTDISQHSKPATIKVLLVKHAKDLTLEVRGRYQIYTPGDGVLITSGLSGKKAPLSLTENGMKWGDLLPGVLEARIVPGDSQSSILVNGIQYRGCIEIYADGKSFNVVNELDVENYLRSILTSQFPTPLNPEVMDAIAITERTNVYHQVVRNPHVYWHVDAADVGYQGYALVFQNLHVDRAIESTRHMVLTYNNTPFATGWTKDSAGKTAEFASIFRKEAPAPAGVQTPYAAKDRDKHQWSFSLSKDQLAKLAKVSDVQGLDLYRDKVSNKVYAAKLKSRDKAQNIDFFRLQKILGKNKLLSNDFTVTAKGDSLVFSGYGEGHGVGLCLYSAEIMAEQGEKAPKILSTFFPKTKLENMRTIASVTQPTREEKLN